MKLLAIYLIALSFVAFLGVLFQPSAFIGIKESDYVVAPNEILNQVNDFRAAHGLPMVKEISNLDFGATQRAIYQYKHHQRNHDGFKEAINESLKNPMGATIGENLAQDWTSDEAVVNAWIGSPAHRQVMLNSTFKYAGIGKYNGYWVLWMSNSL